jgi:endo-1,4-beta-mannosidase
VKGGKIIAVDQDGRPALVANTVGAGKTLLSAYPIETYLASTPSAFEKPETTHRIYEAFRNWAGVKPVFQSDEPSVEVTSLRGEHRGYAVVVNHSAQAYKVTISTSLTVKAVWQIGPENSKALLIDGFSWKMEMQPYEAVIVEWD